MMRHSSLPSAPPPPCYHTMVLLMVMSCDLSVTPDRVAEQIKVRLSDSVCESFLFCSRLTRLKTQRDDTLKQKKLVELDASYEMFQSQLLFQRDENTVKKAQHVFRVSGPSHSQHHIKTKLLITAASPWSQTHWLMGKFLL